MTMHIINTEGAKILHHFYEKKFFLTKNGSKQRFDIYTKRKAALHLVENSFKIF